MKNKKWQNRAVFLGVSSLLFTIAIIIILKVFNDNIVFYFSPSELSKVQRNSFVRVGGVVKDGSVKYTQDDFLEFEITDYSADLKIRYKGIVPNLFKEGQGTVAYGQLQDNGVFFADELLAKHDENYMPPEVAKSLKKPSASTLSK